MSRAPGLSLCWREYKADRGGRLERGVSPCSEMFLVLWVLQALS